MSRYMECFYIDSNGKELQINVTADFEDSDFTTSIFDSYKSHETNIKDAGFIIYLRDPDGDIVDSMPICSESFSMITGEPVLTEKEYIKIDQRCNK